MTHFLFSLDFFFVSLLCIIYKAISSPTLLFIFFILNHFIYNIWHLITRLLQPQLTSAACQTPSYPHHSLPSAYIVMCIAEMALWALGSLWRWSVISKHSTPARKKIYISIYTYFIWKSHIDKAQHLTIYNAYICTYL